MMQLKNKSLGEIKTDLPPCMWESVKNLLKAFNVRSCETLLRNYYKWEKEAC